jgi:hypothetical protein
MDRETFYGRLGQTLVNSGFSFRAEDVSEEKAADVGPLRVLSKAALATLAVAGVHLPEGMFEIRTHFDRQKLQEHLDDVRKYALLVCFKYTLEQPTMLAVVEGDQYSADELVAAAKRFDQALLGMREFTTVRIGMDRLGMTGILLFVFFDHALAQRFIESTQNKCKKTRPFKRVYLVPWTVDVSAREIERPRIPHISHKFLSEDKLKAGLFGV